MIAQFQCLQASCKGESSFPVILSGRKRKMSMYQAGQMSEEKFLKLPEEEQVRVIKLQELWKASRDLKNRQKELRGGERLRKAEIKNRKKSPKEKLNRLENGAIQALLNMSKPSMCIDPIVKAPIVKVSSRRKKAQQKSDPFFAVFGCTHAEMFVKNKKN